MTTRFSTSPDGTRIAYDVAGRGPALMLLHGAGKTRRDWHTLGYVERLSPDFTVITVDIRGTGESDRPLDIASYAIERICQDLYAVADACAARRFAVWGDGFGGNIARYLGAWSDRVTAAAIIGIPFGPATNEQFDRHIDTLETKWGDLIRAYHTGTLSEKQRQSLLKGQTAVWLPCLQAMHDHWPSVEPADMRCPTLLLVGTRSRDVLAWVQANRAALDTARVRVETVAGLNHNQEFTEIDRVFPVVSAFLKTHASR
ncbi:MAG: alpha/beta hydrolase [Chloroflexi bacterium]|nr:alpha/beta hydrolase [Chloroflexota bacterium]MBU1751491.1 alpha/beta hydrolase [Chloroflexota bacterium]